MTIERFADQVALADAAANTIADALSVALTERDQAFFVATGGRTPGAVYDRLGAEPLDWARIVVTLSDERWVDADSPDSNERLIRERLLQGPAAAARFVSLIGGAATAEAAAQQADAALGPLGEPDVVLLGMGEDGHIASLFPRSPALAWGLHAQAPVCIPVPHGEGCPPVQARISLSAAWLTQAKLIVLLITGPRKLDVLGQALSGSDPLQFPVRAILKHPARVRVFWSA